MHKDIHKSDIHLVIGKQRTFLAYESPQKGSYLCSPWGFSSLVRTFLSLVLWAAGSQFSCFSQRCTDPQVRLQNTEPMWAGEVFLAAHKDLTAHTHIHTHSTLLLLLLLMGGEFDPVGSASPSSLLFVLPQYDISGLNSAGQAEKFNPSIQFDLTDSCSSMCAHIRQTLNSLCQKLFTSSGWLNINGTVANKW